MPERFPMSATNLDRYGGADFPWSDVRDILAGPPEAEKPYFLGTVRPDGRPHSTGIGPCWFDGDFYLSCGLATQKARNLALRPECTLSVRLPGFDVVMDGTANLVVDPVILDAVASRFRESGWPATVDGPALTAPYSAQTAGPPPWHLFRFSFTKVVVLRLSDEGGAMRWTFDSESASGKASIS